MLVSQKSGAVLALVGISIALAQLGLPEIGIRLGPVWGVVLLILAAALAIAGVLVVVGGGNTRLSRRSKETISIELTDDLQQRNLQYGVLHIRDGCSNDNMVSRMDEIPYGGRRWQSVLCHCRIR